jgi:1-deoxy-D-xylulose-5-phosphate reductoisomerase
VTRLREVVLLGATGSIGTQAVDVVLRNPDRFRIVALAAGGGRVDLLAEQAASLGVRTVAVAREETAGPLRAELERRGIGDVEILAGQGCAEAVAATPCDVVLNGMTGAVGLLPTLAALRAGAVLALANKESLIIGGPIVTQVAGPGQIVPVDSEHSALAQALRGGSAAEVARLVLTASGGPFRGRSREQLAGVTAAQALEHPTWSMGPVITTNSATLVNKGLEVIEAHLLFDIPFERIDVVVHPQSIVHSMVEFVDGSILAQASPPDMRLPIALGLAWPGRVPQAVPACDFSRAQSWEFEPLDRQAFPAVELAMLCGSRGGTYPAVYNAANEVCVGAFLEGRIGFLDIVDTITAVVRELPIHLGSLAPEMMAGSSVESVLAADEWGRERARTLMSRADRVESEV